jgi:hypothetical protein
VKINEKDRRKKRDIRMHGKYLPFTDGGSDFPLRSQA